MKKIIFCSLLTLLILIFLILSVGCQRRTPTGPEEMEYYDWEFTYIRPEILDSGWDDDPREAYLDVKGLYRIPISLTKINEYKFVGDIENLPIHLRGEYQDNSIYIVDPKRWRKIVREPSGKVWGIPHSIGDRFILRNKQTGYVKELTKIVFNPEFPAQYDPKRAIFKTRKGGVISDY